MLFLKPSSFLALVVLLLAVCWGDAASPPDQLLSGRLIFEYNGGSCDSCVVTLMQGGVIVATAFTDSSGSFFFRNVRPGTYTIHAETDGFELNHEVDFNDRTWQGAWNVLMLTRKPANLMRRQDGSIVDVSQFLQKYPKKSVEAYKKGKENRENGKNDQAIEYLEQAVKLAPDFYDAHNELGLAYKKAGRSDDAEREFLRAHYLNDSNADPLINLTGLYIDENKPDRAVTTGEEAVKANSRSAPAFLTLGMALYKVAMLDRAEAALKRALELAPKMAQVRLMLANVYMKLHRYDSLMEQLDGYLAENPKGDQRVAVEQMRQKLLQIRQDPQP